MLFRRTRRRKNRYARITPSGRKNYNKKFSGSVLRSQIDSRKVPKKHNKKFFFKRFKIN